MHLNLKSKLGCFLNEHKLMWLLKIRFSKATNKCWKWESRPRHMRNIQLSYCPTSPPHSRRTVRRNIFIFVKHYLWSLCQNNFGSLCRLVSLWMVGILNTATSVPIPRVPEKAERCFKSIVMILFYSTVIFLILLHRATYYNHHDPKIIKFGLGTFDFMSNFLWTVIFEICPIPEF